ncbi:DUF397 domain-containing protein [Actinoallomurus sp. CA-150999]
MCRSRCDLLWPQIMSEQDAFNTTWRTSSHSSASGECVEVAVVVAAD